MRLFVALEVPPAWREYGEAVQGALSERFPGTLRLVDPADMHLTLRFIGEVDDLDAPRLKAALARQLTPIEIPLELDRIGTFGSPTRTSSAWLGVGGDLEGLTTLHRRVNEAVEEALGVPFTEGRYTPHVTLARVRRQATAHDRRTLADVVRAMDAPSSEPFVARQALLIRSRLSGSGPHYEAWATFP